MRRLRRALRSENAIRHCSQCSVTLIQRAAETGERRAEARRRRDEDCKFAMFDCSSAIYRLIAIYSTFTPGVGSRYSNPFAELRVQFTPIECAGRQTTFAVAMSREVHGRRQQIKPISG
jgi:hypothetical protein